MTPQTIALDEAIQEIQKWQTENEAHISALSDTSLLHAGMGLAYQRVVRLLLRVQSVSAAASAATSCAAPATVTLRDTGASAKAPGSLTGAADVTASESAPSSTAPGRRATDAPGPHFQCPSCDAEHDRGFLDGFSLFRCLRCGYQGHGFHTDRDIDCALYQEHLDNNAVNRRLGVPEVPLGVDPLSHGR